VANVKPAAPASSAINAGNENGTINCTSFANEMLPQFGPQQRADLKPDCVTAPSMRVLNGLYICAYPERAKLIDLETATENVAAYAVPVRD
jgi:hypothetical protein